MNQTRSIRLANPKQSSFKLYQVLTFESCCRWNVSASGARPNSQGSFKYGSINVNDAYVLRNMPPMKIKGKRRTTLSGISFVNPLTPIRLADKHKEVILQNNDTKMQSYHTSGYAFFAFRVDYGEWTENSRGTYNKWDGIARSTIQVSNSISIQSKTFLGTEDIIIGD
ncbi:hypothetical protein Bca4012_019855 [Brassica carinata]